MGGTNITDGDMESHCIFGCLFGLQSSYKTQSCRVVGTFVFYLPPCKVALSHKMAHLWGQKGQCRSSSKILKIFLGNDVSVLYKILKNPEGKIPKCFLKIPQSL